MDQWSKTTSHLRRNSDCLQHGKLRSNRGSWLDKLFLGIFINFTDIYETGESFFFIFFILFSSPTVDEMSVREREDALNSDISPVPVSELVDDRTGKPVETQANEIPKINQKKTAIER